MSDLPARARRAGTPITLVETAEDLARLAPFDLVLCDAPCSGSGAWRRAPQGKWLLTPDRLAQLCEMQDGILDEAARRVARDEWLVYATCSVLRCENEDRVNAFLARHPDWTCEGQKRFDISRAGDGFFTARLTRKLS
jgi:16S rRNA (cytosine967-C5)-methyltransferase